MRNDSWNLPAPPGFQGLDPIKPMTQYVRHLPHWRQDGATYFVTFRLADSLPQSKPHELRGIKEEWVRRHSPPRSQADWEILHRELTQFAEKWLDQGFGSCVLADKRASAIVVNSMHHFDNDRYDLNCHVVMPNHVHLLVRPLRPGQYPLETILQSWKTYTSREIHRQVGGAGTLWQEESFDRIVRDEEHLYRCIQYIGRNPLRADCSLEQCQYWLRPEWEQIGWKFNEP